MSRRYVAVLKGLSLAVGLTCAQISSACDASGKGIGILPLRSSLDQDQKIGKKKTGLLCVPAGSWYWKDVGFEPGAHDQGIIETLRARGVSVQKGAEFGVGASSSELHLRASVLSFSMDACVPWALTRRVAGGNPFRGSGSIQVRWELYSKSLERVVWEITQRSELKASPNVKTAQDFFRVGFLTAAEAMAGELSRFCQH